MGEPPQLLTNALDIISEQMLMFNSSGLEEAATEIHVGLNGGRETEELAQLIFPTKAQIVYHGLKSRAENLTIVMLENWARTHPDWYVCYAHAKGCTHPPGSSYGDGVSKPWRQTMMNYLVGNWRTCVKDLDAGAESVGCHFMRGMADGTQHIWAGNFFWVTSNFVNTLPSIYLRERIKMSGIAAAESRFESEVWIGNGRRCPRVVEYLPNGGQGVP